MRDLPPHTVIDERYEVLSRLGSGGMADVYCAQDLQLGRKVAVKLLHRRFAEDGEFVERFRREASAAAGLQHPHVVSVYDRGEWDGTYYIAMEYLEGQSLKQIVNNHAPLPVVHAIDYTIQVLRATRFAHKRGVIHRDLKPHNVMVDGEGRAKVTDFGIARAGASDMTQTGSIMGTAQYLSPEQAQGHAVGEPSDLYSVGIILYELLTAKVPFEGDTAVSIALKQVSEAPVSPSELNTEVPLELDEVVVRALQKDPAHRYADADEFIADLERVRELIVDGGATTGQTAVFGAPLVAPLSEPDPVTAAGLAPYPLAPPVHRREVDELDGDPRRWLIGIVLLLLVLGAVAAAFLLGGGGEKPTTIVPNVVGQRAEAASALLQNAGFVVELQTVTSKAPEGTVARQNPQPLTKVEEGSTVTLTVSGGPGKARVPRVARLAKAKATAVLQDEGFEVKVREEFDSEIGADKATRTDPVSGTEIDRGETVTLYISKGAEKVKVPSVLDKSEAEARSELEAVNLKVKLVEMESEDKDPGTVIKQDPAADTEVEEESFVTITVAKAPAVVEVPDVVDFEEDRAVKLLEDRGFRVSVDNRPVARPEQGGIVLEQLPRGGTEGKKGDEVTIVVGEFTIDEGTGDGTPPPP